MPVTPETQNPGRLARSPQGDRATGTAWSARHTAERPPHREWQDVQDGRGRLDRFRVQTHSPCCPFETSSGRMHATDVLTRMPALAQYTALGSNVTVVHDGVVYRFRR